MHKETLNVIRNIIVIVIVLIGCTFFVSLKLPDDIRKIQPPQMALVNVARIIPTKPENPKLHFPESDSIIQYQQSTEPTAKLHVIPNLATYYNCIKPDGSKIYQDEPCLNGDKKSRKNFAEQTNNPIELRPEQNGNYLISGSINGQAVKFMVDTGASYLSLSNQAAAVYGVTGCIPSTVTTANGMINICIAKASQITFGGFQLNNVVVAIMPNLVGNPLLGMNVLKQFKMEQKNSLMRISKE